MIKGKCVYAGSFDPVTRGHEDIIGKCAMMFEKVVVAIGVNSEKIYTFPLEARLDALKAVCMKYSGVTVKAFDGYLADFLREENTTYYVRGIRDAKDEEYETKSFEFNSKKNPDIQTIFLSCDKEVKKISSTFVKSLIAEKKSIEKYVPREALPIIEKEIEKLKS